MKFDDKFDDFKSFPLIDFAYNCKTHLNRIIVNTDLFTKEMDLYYKNLIENSFLKSYSDPIWFINNTVYEEKYLHLNTKELSKKAVNYFNKKGLFVFLSEPLNFYKGNFNKNQLLTSINTFAYKNNLKKVTLYTCEKNVKELGKSYPNLTIYCKNIFLTIISLEICKTRNLDIDFDKKNKVITKRFWCGNGGYCQHRHFIINFLYSKLGNYSWYHSIDLSDNNKNNQSHYKNLNLPADFLTVLKSDYPQYYKILTHNNQKLSIDVPVKMDDNLNFKEKSIIKYYDECFCAVVTETYFNHKYADISEKTLYAIAYGKPFILVAPCGSLEYLKQLGFKTFDQFWSEEYDLEEDAQKRMIMIFDLISKINSYSISYLKDLYKEMQPILEHNLSILKDLPNNSKILN